MTEKSSLAVDRGGDPRMHDAMLSAYRQLPWIVRMLGCLRLRARRKLGLELAAALLLTCLYAHADTGLAMRCEGITVATQAAACTGARTWAHPVAGDVGYYLSYPSVPVTASTVGWTDANLQFRQWVAIPGTYGVGICTANLTSAQTAIPVGGADQCALGGSDTLKPFIAASAVILTTPAAPVPVVSVVGLTWIAPTQNTDGSALTDLAGYNVYQGSSPTTLVKVGSIVLSASTYTTPTLPPGTYYFAVTSTTATAESAQSAVVSALVTPPPVPKVPGAPTNVRITVTVTAGP